MGKEFLNSTENNFFELQYLDIEDIEKVKIYGIAFVEKTIKREYERQEL